MKMLLVFMALLAGVSANASMKILIIDDTAEVRSVLTMGLNLFFKDAIIAEAESVHVALNKLNTYRYDAVISDYDLGAGGRGTEILDWLTRNRRKDKFVLFSSRPPTNFCGAMLAKPFRLQDIKDLKEYLEAT